MPRALPETLTKEYEAKLSQAESREVYEDYDPISVFEQLSGQDQGAHTADYQVEQSVVQEPANPVSGLGQAHHLHGLTDTSLLFRDHAVGDAKSGREKAE